MKAKNLSVNELLHFSPQEGKIYLKDRRTMIIGADALGTLRRDLISALGMERAKGFLLRYGWNCGSNDAKYLADMFSWDDDMERLLAGPKMHGISGNALVVPIALTADKDKGLFYYEGIWKNSYEAEQHLLHFGVHHESVCSTLIGYAGGYCTEYFGKTIIFKEIECVGAGDPHCHYIGKLKEDWGEEIQQELPFYEEENLANKLDKAYQRIEVQNDIFKQALKISHKLSQVVLQGTGLPSIAKILGENLKTTVLIEDANFNHIASYGDYEPYDIEAFIQTYKYSREHEKLISKLLDGKRVVQLSLPENIGWRHERLMAPILLKSEIIGYISLIKETGKFNEMETITLERAAITSAIQMLNERTSFETEQRVKGEIFDELLSGKEADVNNIIYRMKILGYDTNQQFYVFVFHLDYADSLLDYEKEFERISIREHIAQDIRSHLKHYGRDCLVSSKFDKVIALIPEDLPKMAKMTVQSLGEAVIDQLCKKNGMITVSASVSSLCSLSASSQGYHEAIKAHEIASLRKTNKRVILFDELGTMKILFHSKNADELKKFALAKLQEVKKYDDANKGELLHSLNVYLLNQGNMLKTAKDLNVSIGGLRYRIKKIQEISGFDLSNAKDFFDAHLALQILMVYGLLEPDI